MKYQLSEKEKQQAKEINIINTKLKKLKNDIKYSSDSPANKLPAKAGASQIDEIRDISCMYYKNCTLENCLNCKKLK